MVQMVLLTVQEATKHKTDNVSLNFRRDMADKPKYLSAFVGGFASIEDGYSGRSKEYRVLAVEDDEASVVIQCGEESLTVRQDGTLDVGDILVVHHSVADYGYAYEIRVSGSLT